MTKNLLRLLMLFLLCSFGNLRAQVATQVSITGAGAAGTIQNNVSTIVDPNIVITANGNITDFRITITGSYTAGDILEVQGTLPSGITAGAFDAPTRSLLLSGTASAAVWQDLLRRVALRTSSAVCFPEQRQVTYNFGTVFYNVLNNNFYLLNTTSQNWAPARTQASNTSYYGLQGYLTDIVSETENNFIKAFVNVDSWIGSSDDFLQINAAVGYTKYANQGASEGKFHWVTGPLTGTQQTTINGNSGRISGVYHNWANAEPNNSGTEHCGHMLSNGAWNDYPNSFSIRSIIEFGDMPNDNLTSTVVFTRTININGAPTSSITGGNVSICSGGNATLNLTGFTGTVVRWEWSNDNFLANVNTIANTTTTLAITGLTETRYYRAIVNTTSPSCSGLATSPTPVFVNSTVAGNAISQNPTICAGGVATVSLFGNQGSIVDWQRATDAGFTTGLTTINSTATTINNTIASAGTYYFRARVQNGSCGSPVNSANVTITVTSGTPPIGGTVSSASHCGGTNSGTLNLTGNTGTVQKWQFSTDGGVVWTDVANTTTSLSYSGITQTRLYRAVLTSGACGNAFSNAGTVTVYSFSASNNGPVCVGYSLSLGLTAAGGVGPFSFAWEGPLSFTSNLQNPTISDVAVGNGGTYFVTVIAPGCTTAVSTPVTVNISPSITSVTSGSRCGTGTVTLSAAASAGTVRWFAVETGGSPITTGTSYTTPSLTTTTTYYVEALSGTCATADRTAVTASIFSTPTVSSTTAGSRCGTGTVVLGATPSAGIIRWWSASTGGTELGQGTSFTTPSISTTTNYFAQADNGGCLSAARTLVAATINNTPVLSTSSTSISCNGGSNGVASVSASGATAPYTYSWSPSGGTGATASGLSAGTYTVTVTSANTCSTQTSVNVTQPAALSVTPSSQTNIACFGGANGAAAINTPTGGTSPYTYNWTPGNPTGDGTVSVTGLSAGTWTCTVTDANGCTTAQNFTVTQPTALSVTPSSQTNISCNAGSNGSASINTPTGGTPGYTYNWTPGTPTGDGTTTVTGLTAGVWTCTVTDANGCTTAQNFTVTQPTALSVTPSSQTNISCNAGSNGSASINTPTGGTLGYTYNWTPGTPTGDGTTTVTGLTAGVWTCTVTDANGCTAIQNFTVTQPAALSVTPSAQTNIACFGGAAGAASINVPTGGAGGYTYNWTPGNPTGDGTRSVTGLTAATWTCTVTDANGCTAIQNFTVTQPAVLSVTPSSQTNVSCNAGSNGAASINTPTGGTPGYTYNWTPGTPTGDGTTTVTGLTAGVWTCTVTDANGCTAIQNFTVTQPTVLSVTASSQTNVSCNAGSNGAASINTPTGGTPGYTYNWTPGNPTGDGTTTITGLTAGVWTCTVTDANGCTTAQNFTLTQPTVLTASSSQTNVSCNGGSNGSASVVASGGTAGYTYSWSPSGGTAATASGLAAGAYTVTITDANSCQTTRNFTITQPTAITTSITESACDEFVINGQTYSSSGTYTQNLTAANGCDSTLTINLTIIPSVIIQTISAANSEVCLGNSTTIDLGSSETGVKYTLRNDADNSIVGASVSGNGSAISINTGPINTTTTFNVFGESVGSAALNFRGNAFADFVNLGSSLNTVFAGTNKITVEAWVKRNNTGSLQTIVGNYQGPMQYLLRIDGDRIAFWVSDGNFGVVNGGTVLPVNTWMHVAGSWDGSTIRVYYNGVLDGSAGKSGNFQSTTNNLKIGGGLSNNTEFFPGTIGDMRIWNVTRTQSEINTNKNACLTGTEVGLKALYRMTNGEGSSSLTDLTGNGYNGILTNMNPTSSWVSGPPAISCFALCPNEMSGTVTVSIKNPTSSSITETACNTFTLNGQTYTSSGQFIQNLTNAAGCDSTLTLNLTINNSTVASITETACDSYALNGQTYTTSGQFIQNLTNAAGCDSTLTLNLTINNSTVASITETACDSYALNGQTYTTSGQFIQNLTNAAGCDSTLTLNLTINNSSTSSVTATACNSYLLNGQTYTESGIFTQNLTNAAGCDSTLTLNLTINNSTVASITETACDSYALNGQTYTESGVFTQNLTNTTGCDSTLTLVLTINNSSTSSVTTTACDSYALNGQTYTTSGQFVQNLTNAAGCDSTLTLNLTINNSTVASITETACDSYALNGQTYTTSGQFIQNLTNAAGCDSTLTLNLTINNSTVASITETACDSYALNGQTYTASGQFVQNLTNAAGCDSTLTLNLTINNSTVASITETACDSYALNGQTYTTSGQFIQNLTNAAGCDSTLTLNLTINNSTVASITETACDSYALNGQTYTTSGQFIQNLTNAAGCDSTLTLNLTINNSTVASITETACDSYALNGQTYTTSGQFIQNLTNVAGCDSTLTLNLTINNSTVASITETACDSYALNGQTYSISGQFIQNLTNAAGCDSTLTLNLTINNSASASINITTCDSYSINGQTYNATGQYIQNLTTAGGCDSTLTINLNINATLFENIDIAACDSLTINGETYIQSGTYIQTLVNSFGCDSVLTLNVIINTPTTATVNAVGFLTYVLNGQTYSSTGQFVQNLSNANQCDSTLTLNLLITSVAGDLDGNGIIDGDEISGDTGMDGQIDGDEIAGDSNGNGVIDGDENAGDTNGDGTIGDGEVTGDTNGDGVITNPEIAGDSDGNGVIDGNENAGDTNGDGTIGDGEVAGDTNGDGVITNPEIAGDTNGNGVIDGDETAGDTNGNGVIDGDENAGDTNGDGTIGDGEVAGDINGDGVITNPEIAGDTNGNGVIDGDETAGDTNGDGTIGDGEVAGDTNGDGVITNPEIAGDTNGNGVIDGDETAGDTNGDGTIGDGEVAGDTNGDGVITNPEIAGDTNGNGLIDGDEIAGDTNGDGTIGDGEVAGDTNGDGVITNPEIAGDTDGDGVIDGDEIAGDTNGDGQITAPEIDGDTNGNGEIDGNEIEGDANNDGVVDCLDYALLDLLNQNMTVTACDSYVVDGVIYTQSGVYVQSITDSNGCVSELTLQLTINNSTSNTITESACNTYSLNGETYTTSGQYIQNLTNEAGCDSTITLNLTINNSVSSLVNASICEGETYTLPNNLTVTEAGEYEVILQTINGCDSVITTTLIVNPTFNATVNATICQGETYTLPNGQTATTSGTFTSEFQTAAGCDSNIVTVLIVNPAFNQNVNASICQGGTYTLPNGQVVTTAGIFTSNLQTEAGCDSIIVTTINIVTSFATTETVAICEGENYVLPSGLTVTTSGTYTSEFQTATGCDSTITTELTVNPTFNVTVNATICQGETYTLPNGQTATTSGTFTSEFQTAAGCDSNIVTVLIVNPAFNQNVTASICQGETYTLPNGQTATTSGTYTSNLQTDAGCDSIIVTTLNVGAPFASNETVAICEGETYTLPSGQTVTTSGTFTSSLQTASGCDSIITTVLTVNPTFNATVNATICQGETYTLPNGQTATTSGTFTSEFQTAAGCDSNIFTVLIVNPAFNQTVNATICEGETYTLPNGQTATTSGTFTSEFQTAAGCDSIIVTTLQVNPVYNTNSEVTVCQGLSYTLPDGSTTTTSGTYTFEFQSVAGCDSTVIVALTFQVGSSTTFNVVGFQTYTAGLETYTESGTYQQTFTSNGGCDSVLIYNVLITVIAGDQDGNGVIDGDEFAGDVNLDGQINGNEIAGDNNGDGEISGNEIVGDVNGDGEIAGTEIPGDANGNGTIEAPEILNDADNSGTVDCEDLTLLGKTINTEFTVVGVTISVPNEVGNTYQWVNWATGVEIAGATSASFTPTANGFYRVFVTNEAFNCTVGSIIIQITSVGIDQIAELPIRLYPNPTSSYLFIDELPNNTLISIYDAAGRLLDNISNQSMLVKLDVSAYANGVYFVRLASNGKFTTSKFVVNR